MHALNTSAKSGLPRRGFFAMLGGLVTLLFVGRRAVRARHHDCLICQARETNTTSFNS